MDEIEFIYGFQYVPSEHLPRVVHRILSGELSIESEGFDPASEEFVCAVEDTFGEAFISLVEKRQQLREAYETMGSEASPIYTIDESRQTEVKKRGAVFVDVYMADAAQVSWEAFS